MEDTNVFITYSLPKTLTMSAQALGGLYLLVIGLSSSSFDESAILFILLLFLTTMVTIALIRLSIYIIRAALKHPIIVFNRESINFNVLLPKKLSTTEVNWKDISKIEIRSVYTRGFPHKFLYVRDLEGKVIQALPQMVFNKSMVEMHDIFTSKHEKYLKNANKASNPTP